MNINEIIRDQVKEEVALAIKGSISELEDTLLDSLHKPEYQGWGRFFDTTQAKKYLGCRSVNGMKSLLKRFGIQGSKVNSKVVKYDREQLDKVNVNQAIEEYKKSLI